MIEEKISMPKTYSLDAVLTDFIRESLQKGYMFFMFPGNKKLKDRSALLYIQIEKKELSIARTQGVYTVLRRLIKKGVILFDESKGLYSLNPNYIRYLQFGDSKSIMSDEPIKSFTIGLRAKKSMIQVYGQLIDNGS